VSKWRSRMVFVAKGQPSRAGEPRTMSVVV
jgi:hypothetical protein